MNFCKKSLSLFFCVFCLSISVLATESTADDNWDGEQYLKNSGLQYQWATSYIKKLQLQGTEKILDIGCGDGRVTAIIAHAVPDGKVIGVDNSESMLQTAQKLQQKLCFDNLAFSMQDATQLNFAEEFDLIVSFSCFHWVPNHFAALQGIEKSLKPGGKVFLYFVPDHGRDRFDSAINAVVSSPKWASYFSNFSNPYSPVTPSKFATYAEDVHLLIKRFEIITIDEAFPDKAAFIAWMSGWLSYLKLLPKELHAEFLDEIMVCYLKTHPADAAGQIHYIDYWMEVELLKKANYTQTTEIKIKLDAINRMTELGMSKRYNMT